jgi:[acyl-carrier-protein] S-malonyltransferase
MSADFGLLFPGQGSQAVGMGADLYERYPAARDVYDRATDVLEFDIRKLSFEGPEDDLRQTRYTQPALLTHSMAVLAVLPALSPICAAGHSLGEYSALCAAGALDLVSALRLVKRRGELMFAEGTKRPGTMAAILALEPAAVEQVCRDAGGVVVPANYNEPKQTVISGEIEAVKRAAELAKLRGALKAVMLPVSGAFHSPLLNESAAEFSDFLRGFEFREPRFPVIPNVSGQPVRSAAELREQLSRQLINPVRWTDTVTAAQAIGCRSFLEVGSGQVLAGLVRRINRELAVTPLGKAADVAAFGATGS